MCLEVDESIILGVCEGGFLEVCETEEVSVVVGTVVEDAFRGSALDVEALDGSAVVFDECLLRNVKRLRVSKSSLENEYRIVQKPLAFNSSTIYRDFPLPLSPEITIA